MKNIFESDFRDFLFALNTSSTEYIVVGGYAVIMHGYYRTTMDMDIWVNKTEVNYTKLSKAFAIFGMPMFDITLENFLSNRFDVFSIGRSPLRIDIITQLKGLSFPDANEHSLNVEMEGLKVKYLRLDDLIKAKKSSGRHKDMDDIEKLGGQSLAD